MTKPEKVLTPIQAVSFTFTEKAWDAVRPDSVKKTGVSDGINKLLKLVPGADSGKLTTPADCEKALLALVALEKLVSKAQNIF